MMDSCLKCFIDNLCIDLKLSNALYISSLHCSIAATNFALSMGFSASNLTTPYSEELWSDWKSKNCQPNYWKVNYTQIIYCRCSLIHIYRMSLQIILRVADHTNQQVTRLSETDNAWRPPTVVYHIQYPATSQPSFHKSCGFYLSVVEYTGACADRTCLG